MLVQQVDHPTLSCTHISVSIALHYTITVYTSVIRVTESSVKACASGYVLYTLPCVTFQSDVYMIAS